MKQFFQEYFNFSSSERNATLLLLLLLLLSIGILIYVKNLRPNHSINQEVLEKELAVIDSLNSIENKENTENKQSKLTYSTQTKSSTYSSDYQGYDKKEKKKVGTEQAKKDEPEPKKELVKVNLNTSDSLSFGQAGFKPWVIKRIIKYRSLLGGYHSKSQLLEVYGMKQRTYDWIAKRVFISSNPSLRKIDLNTASFKDILRHPYLDYEQVKSIANLRDKKELTDSSLRDLLGKDLYTKLAPYLIL